MSVLSKMTDFIYEIQWEDIPETVIRASRSTFTDSIGCLMLGTAVDRAKVMYGYLVNLAGKGETGVPGSALKTDMQQAALAGGFFSHSQDFDNSSCFLGHGSSVIIPTLLSVGQNYPCSGRDLLKAYIISMECGFQLSKFIVPEISFRGFHGTSVFGCITSAIAAGMLQKIDRKTMKNAIGLAATQGAGLMVNFGTDGKFFHVGMAAANGIRAVELAKCGMEAAEEIFEGNNGFAQAFSGKPLMEADINYGLPWALDEIGLLIKMFPCCSAAHSSLCGVREIMKENAVCPSDIDTIEVRVPEYTLHCLKYEEPKEEGECRFSMQYALANMWLFGKFNLKSFEPWMMENKELRETMKHIHMTATDEFPEFLDTEPAIVQIQTKQGKVYGKRMDYAGGRTVETPCCREELMDKFFDCTEKVLSRENSEKLFEICCSIDNQPNLNTIFKSILQ